jgi:3-oxoacyl-[acyl-carrier protein] reductase
VNVLVTGGSRGLGAAVAEAFAAAGHAVCTVSRSPLAAGAHPAGPRAFHLTADLARDDAVPALIATLRQRWDRLDCLVNNAGIQGRPGRAWTLGDEEWRQVFQVNLFAPVALSAACVPWMAAHGGGSIINVSGGGATAPRANFAPYAASKAALVRHTENLAVECRNAGIRVNAIAPGALNTAMLDEVLAAGPAQVGEKEFAAAQERALSGGDDPGRATALCLYLASASATGITGRLISAVWDPWEDLHSRADLGPSDIYTLRRIVPKDRGQEWGER